MMGVPQPKGKPQMLVREERTAEEMKIDREETAKVKLRSKGQCEVTISGVRCRRRGFETHHHIGGWKLRGRGESALAKNKTHACTKCHRQITGNTLEHLGGNRYRRV